MVTVLIISIVNVHALSVVDTGPRFLLGNGVYWVMIVKFLIDS